VSERVIALLVAAGAGERMQSDLPKPYMHLGDQTLLHHAARTFLEHPGIDGVRVVIRREHHALYKKAIEGLALFPCVMGGERRQDSVRLGLESLAHRKPETVLIHDVARPLVSPLLITRVLDGLKEASAVIPALPVADTLKRAKNGVVSETVSRENVFSVQTPQGFHFPTLLEAHRAFAKDTFTDDAALIEKTGEKVLLVEGDYDNIKITTRKDMERMIALLALDTETRVGHGYDVHTLQPHDQETPIGQQNIKLCGIRIPFSHHLEGHSDADVGLHALVDALLGAMSEGDIGEHFPPDDRKWQGAESGRFLLYTYELLKNRGGDIVHLDVTIICERPKVAPHREQMRNHIAQLLKLSPDRVSVKATTTEKLGFEGRGEGIAAQAVATVRLPRK
jgi:2-C-methyl-D-erythritol 4-phosphate cytidylyltransferase/2-C-methyl-D-erythritol 2,4-cyclodiphosphate synthase